MTTKVYWRGANLNAFPPDSQVQSLFNTKANIARCVLYVPNANDASSEEWKTSIRQQLDIVDSQMQFLGPKDKFLTEIHLPPGGMDAQNKARMWTDRPWGLVTLKEMWIEIANRYKNEPRIHVYDILNEPACASNDKVQAMYVDIIKAIRKINPVVRISVSTPFGSIPTSEPFRSISALKDKNIWYQVHIYKPMTFTHQGVYPEYPIGTHYPTTGANKTKLKAWLNVLRQFQLKYNANIFIGEFCASIYGENDDTIAYCNDVISICEEWGWQWCHLSWENTGPWNSFRSAAYEQMLLNAWSKNA